MDYEKINWRGFEGVQFNFKGLPAKVIKPNVKPNGHWMLKTEYFDAFPETEIELLNRGWHLAFNENHTRWAEDIDVMRKAEFVYFVANEFNLDEKCVPVGMSCGGLYAVKLTAVIPQKIACLYIDAPVMNLLSCPFGLGIKDDTTVTGEEYTRITGRTLKDMISYREHPIDKMHVLLENKIPVIMVSGDSDKIVPYVENGALLEKYYKENGGKISVFIKEGGDHHPHGLQDPKIVADEIEKFIK